MKFSDSLTRRVSFLQFWCLTSKVFLMSLVNRNCQLLQVDMSKVKLDSIKPWITKKLTEILKLEDDVVVEFVFNQLEEKVRIFIDVEAVCVCYKFLYLKLVWEGWCWELVQTKDTTFVKLLLVHAWNFCCWMPCCLLEDSSESTVEAVHVVSFFYPFTSNLRNPTILYCYVHFFGCVSFIFLCTLVWCCVFNKPVEEWSDFCLSCLHQRFIYGIWLSLLSLSHSLTYFRRVWITYIVLSFNFSVFNLEFGACRDVHVLY